MFIHIRPYTFQTHLSFPVFPAFQKITLSSAVRKIRYALPRNFFIVATKDSSLLWPLHADLWHITFRKKRSERDKIGCFVTRCVSQENESSRPRILRGRWLYSSLAISCLQTKFRHEKNTGNFPLWGFFSAEKFVRFFSTPRFATRRRKKGGEREGRSRVSRSFRDSSYSKRGSNRSRRLFQRGRWISDEHKLHATRMD